jgi:uncharacterized membrane-anchored protein
MPEHPMSQPQSPSTSPDSPPGGPPGADRQPSRTSGARRFRRSEPLRAGEIAEVTSVTVTGRARVGRRTKDLVKVLRPGEVAVIDHLDLDRVAGEGLAASRAVAVVNASRSISGRYPNSGPRCVVNAGILLVDDVGPEVMDTIGDGDLVTITDGVLTIAGAEVARGQVLGPSRIEQLMEQARDSIGNELEAFAVNTLEYIEKEAREFFQPIVLPDIRTRFAGRHVLIVVRGHDYKEDLRSLRSYIVEYHPVLVAVDGGADALLDMKLTPDMIIGDFDSLSERAPGREELAEHALPYLEFVIEGTSEDAAMMLAYECRAELIVAVGTHATMVEFLDKGRSGMSSTFLTRLRLGPMLIDAKGVSQLYHGRVRRRDLLMLVIAAIVVILAVALVSESLQVLLRSAWLYARDLWYSLTGRFS